MPHLKDGSLQDTRTQHPVTSSAGSHVSSPPAEVDLTSLCPLSSDSGSGASGFRLKDSCLANEASQIPCAGNRALANYFDDFLDGDAGSANSGPAESPSGRLESLFSNLASLHGCATGQRAGGGVPHNDRATATGTFLEEDDDDDRTDGMEGPRSYSNPAARHRVPEPFSHALRAVSTGGAAPPTHAAALGDKTMEKMAHASAYFVEDDDDEGDGGEAHNARGAVTIAKFSRCKPFSVVYEDDNESDDADDLFGDAYGSVKGNGPQGSPSSSSSMSRSSDIRTVEATALGKPTAIIGQGGDRGSQVFRLDLTHVEQMRREREAALRAQNGRRTVAVLCDERTDLVDLPVLEALVQEAIAYKLYRCSISPNELEFIETSFALSRLREHILSPKNTDTNATSRVRSGKGTAARGNRQSLLANIGASFRFMPAALYRTDEEKMLYAAHHLVFPGAVVKQDGEKRGLLMPLYDYSLKQFLLKHTDEKDKAVEPCGRSGETHSSVLLSGVAYSPIGVSSVVAAIAFQVLEGIRLLNHHMPHTTTLDSNGCGDNTTTDRVRRTLPDATTREFDGFSHNDLHMDNILLSKRGRVAICDFELVANLPVETDAGGNPLLRRHWRLPPPCRRSPHGVFSASSDVWAFGLFILALLTGVDPLFSNEGLANDFSDGPFLKPSSEASDGEAVIDWEANIAAHVEGLLRQRDPTGRLSRDAAPLLQVCAKALINANGEKPATASALLREPIFLPFLEHPDSAEKIVEDWVGTFPDEAH